ncbi:MULTISPECIES: UDP-2,3-diacylglucosamine diphosphatase [Alteromonadaceae]|uniref:UDP-2,3-diacylglucosamine hydrolase n=1 Tax=Brumicola blandensis TaxID=3075611 RepID=A0AAW8QW19_9ALTE|nr:MULTISPECIES: UDP-2,3-diacylglucosamine diphosphatase [unclassified Alteromonas]MDT0581162.1 UDP-2,3-diacylglucosamine diphosphatase [Alteromonas sp. W409]MDT0626779.1 UDP-2,3-diacylglucosamine diphosphatase [Alteromonas sp. W364]
MNRQALLNKPVTYFISDLHLSADRDDINACLFRFLETEAKQADALYILGDLFEVWIGDDNITEFSESIAEALRTLSKTVPIYFIHGNRDFAIREEYAEKAGMTILPEQDVINLYGRLALIMHGDELCTRDVAYQKFRKKSRSWWWPRLMLLLPLSMRKNIAEKGRETSKNNQKQLTADIMDVTQSEVEDAMRNHEVDLLIHGHTHRPFVHHFKINGKPMQRIVLGDWYDQGSILVATPDSLALETRQF